MCIVKKIRRKYLRGWFWFDILATVPFDRVTHKKMIVAMLIVLQVAEVMTQTNIYESSERLLRTEISITEQNQASLDIIRYFKIIRLTKVAGLLRKGLKNLSRIT